MLTTTSTRKIEIEVSAEMYSLLELAAAIQGESIDRFASAIVRATAQEIAEENYIHLTEADQLVFAEALLNPPPQTPALARAFAKRAELLRESEDTYKPT